MIDYDGMYVEGLPIGSGNEIGHKDFQHPLRTAKEYGPNMDRFSLILIDLALAAIIERPSLLSQFKSGGEALLFKANDFKDPANSHLFDELARIPAVSAESANFRAICQAPVDAVPSLKEFLAGNGIPFPTTRSAEQSTSRPVVVGYISTYDVLDASNYSAVAVAVGQKVELIGQIVDVKKGVGKRGRGRGRPYVFINFGNWQKDCVKLTIWSEALDDFTAVPNTRLVGQWVSVIGLIDPPYEGAHYGKAYRNIGITIDRESQITQISAKEAAYRLTKPATASPSIAPASSNRDVLRGLSGQTKATVSPPTPRTSAPQVARAASVSPNKAILATIQTSTNTAKSTTPKTTTASQPQKSPASTNPSVSPTSKGSNAWVFWVAGALFIFFVLFGG